MHSLSNHNLPVHKALYSNNIFYTASNFLSELSPQFCEVCLQLSIPSRIHSSETDALLSTFLVNVKQMFEFVLLY